MDKSVSIRMFSVEQREGHGVLFSAALRAIFARELVAREREVEPEIVIRLERLSDDAPVVRGEIMRLQSANLPPKALSGEPAVRLGVGSIGHSAVFAYDREIGALALQVARSGITPARIALYVEALHGSPYDVWPILNADSWTKIRHGRIRAARIRLATPSDLRAADDDARSIKQGLRRLKEATDTHYLDVSFTMGRGDPDLDRARTMRLFRWFHAEREAGRGDVKRLAASVSDGEKTEILNLIGAQMGATARLELPDDDPTASYELRSQFALDSLHAHRDELVEQLG